MIDGLGCKRATKEQENDIMSALSYSIKSYTFNKNKFSNLYEIYIYAKKNKISKGDIKNEIGTWGDIESLLSMTKKKVKDMFLP